MIKIGIIDDDLLVRKGLCLLVNTFDGMEVTFEAESGSALLAKIQSIDVDVILLDFHMPEMDGAECCAILKSKRPEIKVLFVSHSTATKSIQNAINAGANGFFSKNSKLFELETAINNVKFKDFYFSADMGALIRSVLTQSSNELASFKECLSLSTREIEVVRLACKEHNNVEIANLLNITVRTVESHRQRIMEKTNSKNFIGVILFALKQKIISIDDL